MGEQIQEPVSVETAITNTIVMPARLIWRKQTYICTSCGMHYTTYEGDTLYHMFYMTTQEAVMHIALNTKTLRWTLLEIEAV